MWAEHPGDLRHLIDEPVVFLVGEFQECVVLVADGAEKYRSILAKQREVLGKRRLLPAIQASGSIAQFVNDSSVHRESKNGCLFAQKTGAGPGGAPPLFQQVRLEP